MTQCVLKRPTTEAIFSETAARFSSTVLGGGVIVPDSNEWWAVTNDVLAQETWWAIAEQQWRETDPRTQCCDNLVRGAALNGVYPRPARPSAGYVKLTGTAGAALNTGIAVTFDGQTWRVDAGASVPPTMPDTGVVYVRMAAEVPGARAAGPLPSSINGTLITPPPGVDSVVTVMGGQFCGGADAETCEAFRTRYLRRLSYGGRYDYRVMIDDMLQWPCATRACMRECSCCPERGRFDFYVFFDNTFQYGIPPQSVVDEMTDWYFGKPQGFGLGQADVGIEGRFWTATAVPVNVTVTNLPCTSELQLTEIRNRIASMFSGICPGKQICRRMIDAIVIQVMGAVCDFDVALEPIGSSVTFCEDFTPACDELPVAGTITVRGGSLR